MNTLRDLMSDWQWDPGLVVLAAACVTYFAVFKSEARPGYFLSAIAVIGFALLSPLQVLAEGVLFSAHMTQHILLLLIAPALLLASLPSRVAGRFSFSSTAVAIGWIGGVGSMWFWHAPNLCTAAVTVGWVHAAQSISLVVLGTAFWWPIFGPADTHRLSPGAGIAYLATACLACTALGILLTLTPIQVCPIFRAAAPLGVLGARIRSFITAEHDQQIGGLLMWVPMCLVYLAAIMLELLRWWRPTTAGQEVSVNSPEKNPAEAPTAAAPMTSKAESGAHLPLPTFWPAGLALGVTLLFWSLITSWVVLVIGAWLFIVSLAGWIRDIRHERKTHP